MPDKFHPFMLALTAATNVPGAKVNIARVVEAIIIAVICAAGTAYLTVSKLETKLELYQQLAQRDRLEIKNDIAKLNDVVMDHIITNQPKR